VRFLANLKCNHTRASFAKYAEILDANLSANDDVTVFPPFSAFDLAAHKFKLGAQNFYPCESGAHTGEIGKAMLDEFGVKSVLIGHSERRELGGILPGKDQHSFRDPEQRLDSRCGCTHAADRGFRDPLATLEEQPLELPHGQQLVPPNRPSVG